MTTFNDAESGSSVRTKINAAITTVDSLGTGDNLLLTAAERSAIAANTAKTSNATHTGDVTGSTALTIADDAVTLAKIADAALSGVDATLITGTAGTASQIATWNADGDLVGTAPDTISGLTEKVTPASGDWLVLSDTAAAGVMKKADVAFFAPVADPTFTGEIGIGAVNVSETELGILEGATLTTTELNYVDGVTSAIQTQIDTKAATTLSVEAKTGTTYTLVLGDAGKKVTMSNASANTLTIPTNSSVAFPTGTIIGVSMIGAGTTTVTGDTGVTVNGVSAGGAAISAQYTGVTLTKIGTDTWLMEGNHGTVA